jgi:hypothetical protein
MGTAYEYYSKLRVARRIFVRTGTPQTMLVLGLPEKHGYDLDYVLLAQSLCKAEPGNLGLHLTVCEDRADVLAHFEHALGSLTDPTVRHQVELVSVESLIDTDPLSGRQFDWVISTASVQRLIDQEIVTYLHNARQMADYALLFIPNGGNRAHLTLSGLRGLSLEEMLALCRHAGTTGPAPRYPLPILAAGWCDIPPFPPGLERSTEAKERAMHSPLETLAMWMLQWWCRGETWMPKILQRRLAHLVYVALDLHKDAA